MKIVSVETFLVQHNLPRASGPSTAYYTLRDALLVKVTTDEGVTGWGETAPIAGARAVIEKQLAPLLIGQSPLNHRRLWRQLWGPNFGNGLAVGAIDMALHDLRGKALNLSVAELYGGRLRERVPAYASSMGYTEGMEPEQQYPEEAMTLMERGFRAIKMRIGGFSPRRDLDALAAVRDVVGPDVKLMVDGNGAYTLSTAIRIGRELERLGFFWFEEPLPQPNYTAYEALTDKLDIAIAGGEVVDGRGAAKDLITRRAVDIIQPDVSLCGGIGECLFIAELARLWNIECVPHCWGGAVVLAATLQVLALLPDATWARATETPMLELDVGENPFRDLIVTDPVQLRDGFVNIPQGPGLGIEIDENLVRCYECK